MLEILLSGMIRNKLVIVMGYRGPLDFREDSGSTDHPRETEEEQGLSVNGFLSAV